MEAGQRERFLQVGPGLLANGRRNGKYTKRGQHALNCSSHEHQWSGSKQVLEVLCSGNWSQGVTASGREGLATEPGLTLFERRFHALVRLRDK